MIVPYYWMHECSQGRSDGRADRRLDVASPLGWRASVAGGVLTLAILSGCARTATRSASAPRRAEAPVSITTGTGQPAVGSLSKVLDDPDFVTLKHEDKVKVLRLLLKTAPPIGEWPRQDRDRLADLLAVAADAERTPLGKSKGEPTTT